MSQELEADAYPVVAEVINAAHESYEAWREWMDATDDITGRQKAIAHGKTMERLCSALAEGYKVIPILGDGSREPVGQGHIHPEEPAPVEPPRTIDLMNAVLNHVLVGRLWDRLNADDSTGRVWTMDECREIIADLVRKSR